MSLARADGVSDTASWAKRLTLKRAAARASAARNHVARPRDSSAGSMVANQNAQDGPKSRWLPDNRLHSWSWEEQRIKALLLVQPGAAVSARREQPMT